MKRFALGTLFFAFSIAHVARADDEKLEKQQPVRQNAPAPRSGVRNVGQPRQFSAPGQNRRVVPNASFRAPQFQRTFNPNPRMGGGRRSDRSFVPRRMAIAPTDPAVLPNIPPGTTATNNGAWSARNGRGRVRNWQNGGGLISTTGDQRLTNHDGTRRDWRSRHQNFHDNHAGDPNFSHLHQDWHRQHQTRDWWRSHYSRFALFGGGCYYWNSGFWYPAYGYDPSFSTYSYDAPIYGYNDLEPAQVIANVQAQLQRSGYYRGELDGEFGPMTRRALLDYQEDNGLEVTGEIDEATLDSLGLQ